MRSPCMIWLPIALCSIAFGCGETEGDVGIDENAALMSENGLRVINGLRVTHGVNSLSTNGLSLTSGLATKAGLFAKSGLMTASDGRDQVASLVRCALPANASITKGSYTFQGLMGMAPQWKNGACDTTCQENVSACMLAHVNTAGIHVPLWLVAQNAAVGWGQDPGFPNQEAAFFGNV